MKDIHKNPIVYYVGIPAVVALWPLLVWLVYLPNVGKEFSKINESYQKAQKAAEDILTLDPVRLDFAEAAKKSSEFDYAVVIERTARLCEISTSNYTFRSDRVVKSKGQKIQGARVTLNQIDVTKFSKFLSELRFRWPNLECSQLKLTHLKGGQKDSWKVDMDLKYYY